ncbi:PAS domain S-box-containing protein [Prosthecobacter fusiformis]|uniref:histidine kinase n=1 Tax=Prosthecobacter fusiformis TaxID=48464 RepID=A0A4R7RUA1_9BACT|nr:PAS domain S-box protein [Prosthecobacter fusiformis]TDU69312.1 PAS domain S-box-containing protein [Prosthecobacter fusiformis]
MTPQAPISNENTNQVSWLKGGGEVGRRVREFDWSDHPLGTPENWPQSLKTSVSLMLNSRYAMWMGWGSELFFFCNDAYLPTLGLKTNWLGTPARIVWKEIWPDVGPRTESVVKDGVATWDEGLLLFLERSGFAEETYHTFSYSPISGEDGLVGGMLCVVTEETERVINERRLRMLRELAAGLTGVKNEKDLCSAFQECVQQHPKDLPFALIYLLRPGGHETRLGCSHGINMGHPMAPDLLDLDSEDLVWPLNAGEGVQFVGDLQERFTEIPFGTWDIPSQCAAVIPVTQQGKEGIAGHLVVGINPYRSFDAAYQGFLELLAGQVSGALSNVRMYEQEKQRVEEMAAMDRAKTAFFSNVSHEFRTPLTLMLSPLEDLLNKQHSLSDADLQLAGVAHRNGLRLLKLVNTLLDFSRIEAGRIEAAFEPVDLARLTMDLASGFRSALEKAGLKLTVECPPLREEIYVDRELWEKIVLNLLSNAFKFTLEGEIHVSVRDVEDGVKVSVRDTGAGIPLEAQARLFERFYRVQGTQGRSFEGTGIGLALVNELVKLHGGDVTVESQPGQGSTFTVHLLRGKEHLPAEHVRQGFHPNVRKAETLFTTEAEQWVPDASAPGTASPVIGSSPRMRILVADDNADMRGYVASLLSADYEVEAVADGNAAWTAIQRQRPDLVLSDAMMPGMDGFGLLQAVRGDAMLRTLPVILLSARAGEEAKVEGLDAGADDYLIKPFNARELLARVKVHLSLLRLRLDSLNEVTQVQNRLQHMLSLLPAGVYACDEKGRITFFNPLAAKLWGRAPDPDDPEIRYCGFHQVLLPDGRLLTQEETPVAQAVKNGKSFRNVEAEVVRADGTKFNISISIDPLRDDQGHITGAINIFQDITESKANALALKKELEERRRTEEHATFLSMLSQKLSLMHEPAEILEAASAMVGMHLKTDRCGFIEVDDAARMLTVRHDWARDDIPRQDSQHHFEDFGPIEFWKGIAQKGFSIADTSLHAPSQNFIQNFDKQWVRAFAVAPFTQGGRLRTLLAVTTAQPRCWREDEQNLLENVVSRVQPLVVQARAAQDLQIRGERMQLLTETLAQLLSARNPETVVRNLFAKVAWHLRADTYFNFMVTPAGDALEMHSCAGITEEQASNIRRLEFGQSICGTVAETCQGIVANDIQHSGYDKADLVRSFGIQTYACHPLIAGGHLLGTLSFASRTRPQFDEDELKFIRIVTHSAALVLEQLNAAAARLHLATIVTSSDDAILSKDLDGKIASWNLGAERMFGYKAAEIIGKPVTILIPEDRQEEEPLIMDRIRAGESIEHYETVRQRKDGSLLDISLTISPIRDSEGNVTGISKIGRDITDRKKNELELLRREQLYRSIGESINYGIWVCDAQGRNIYSSDSFLKLVGLTQEECSGMGWASVLHPDAAAATIEEWNQLSNDSVLWEKEYLFKGADGRWHPTLARGIPIRDEKGEIIRWAGINLDISTFKKTEEALRQQSEILAVLNQVSSTLVAERNLEKIVQSVTDASRDIAGAEFAAFFYSAPNDNGESFTLCTLSGVSQDSYAEFSVSEDLSLLGPAFLGEGVVRLDDVTNEISQNSSGIPKLLPEGFKDVRSYLAVPVVSNSGKVIGGLFLGHTQPGVFKEAVEGILMGMVAQAAIGMDNASLYSSLQRELDQVKRVQAALRASESRWRDLAEAMPHLVWTCGPDGAWDFVSPQWCEYTGLQEADQRGFGWSNAIHPEDLPVFESAWNAAAHNHSALDLEVRIRRADGLYRWFKTRAVPVKDSAGNILKWYGSNTDIEDIKLTDSILREREAHLSAIFTQAGSGIAQTDLAGRIVMVNDAYCEIVGRSRAELLEMNIHVITHPDDQAQNIAVFDAMMNGGSSFIIEKRDVRPNGEIVWVRNSVVGIRNDAGEVIAGLIITQDITDSREAEDALRASEEQLRLVTDHAPVLLAQLDQRHIYKFVNKPYAERYGFEPQEVLGKHVSDVAGSSAYLSALPMLEKAFAGQQVEFEMAIPYDNIGQRWGHVIFVPEHNAEGDVVGVVTMLTDITIRKQAELDLEQARDSALEAVRAKDDFLARLSHELRTPLSPVLLLASEGSTNQDIPENVRAEFEIIRKNVDLEARLIDDLLDITRITRGKLILDLQPVDMHAIIQDAIATIRGEADARRVSVTLSHTPGNHLVMGDAVRLQQVLWNLLNNAVKFTSSGGTITVETHPVADGKSLSIQVVDNGIGMSEDELGRIFDAFSQGDHAGKGSAQHFGGLGLGLAITRMLVELHQGQICAHSDGRGHGSTFVVHLPLLKLSSATTPVPVRKLPAAGTSVRAAQVSLRILLVEDHEPTRGVVAALLRRRRHEVSLAGSLEEARQQVVNGTFDLLISDLGLPDGTGYELMEEIGHHFRLKGIAVSGFGMEQDIHRSRAAGFLVHLIKPVRIEALENAINTIQSPGDLAHGKVPALQNTVDSPPPTNI